MWESETDSATGEWGRVDVPLQATLYDIVETAAGPCAVGEAGTVLGRGPNGWGVVDSDGPRGRERSLRAVAVTDDGDRVWFAGEEGALAGVDVAVGESGTVLEPGAEGDGTFWAMADGMDADGVEPVGDDADGEAWPGQRSRLVRAVRPILRRLLAPILNLGRE